MTRAELKKKLAMSVILFMKVCIPGMAKVDSADFHYEIERRLMDLSIRQFNVVAPRGHAKSSLVAVAFVLWHIFLQDIYSAILKGARTATQKPKYIVLISKTQKEAIKRLRSIRYILGDLKSGRKSKKFAQLFGEWGERTALKWRDDLLILRDGTAIEAVGTQQQVRGMLEGDQRPTLVVVDDPEDEQNTITIESMRKNRAWLLQSVTPALDPQIGRWVVIGTPQNTDCMVVHLHRALGENSLWFMNDLETNSSFWSISEGREEQDANKAELKHVEEQDRFAHKGGVLWPAWVPTAELRTHKALAEEMMMLGSYYREWECKIVGDEDQVFTPEMFNNVWEGELLWDKVKHPYLRITALAGIPLESPKEVPVTIITAIDPAFSVSAYSDKTAMVNLAVDKDDNIYELDWVYKKLFPDVLLDTIRANHERFKPERGVIETTAAQIFVAEELYREFGINYKHDKPVQKKKGSGSRIERLQPVMASGKFFFKKGTPARAELLSYPRGKDDYADALEKAVRFRAKPKHEKIVKTDKELDSLPRKYYDYMTA